MSFLSKLFGSKDPEAQAQKLISELSFRSPDIAALEAAIDRFERQNPMLGALGGAAGIIGGGPKLSAALQPLRDLKQRLAQAQEREKNVRAQTALKLGELGHPIAVEPLITALKDKYPLVRSNVARALGNIGDKRAIEPLISLTQEDLEKDKGVREVTLQALEIIQKTSSAEKVPPPSPQSATKKSAPPPEEMTGTQKAAIEKLLKELGNEYNIEARIKASEELGELKSFGEMDVVSALTTAANKAALQWESKRMTIAMMQNVRPEQIVVQPHADDSRVTIAAVKALRKLANRSDDIGKKSKTALEDIKKSIKDTERKIGFYAELVKKIGF